MTTTTQPAHHTKHLPSLAYPVLGHTFYLAQSDDGRSNGTALWLSAQILSLHLAYTLKQPSPTRPRRPRAVELGSGIGLTALVLSALGYDVLATDTRHVCDSVLIRNVAANLPHLPATAGSVQVRELDWNNPTHATPNGDHPLGPPFDFIIASDTLYDPSLVRPFFRTVQALAASSRETGQPRPRLLLAFERRDPQFIDDALACAPVPLTQVPTKKVRKALERAGLRWTTTDWEGVEIWHGQLTT